MLTADETDNLFWQKYVEAIKKLIDLGDGQNGTFFLAVKPENGPLVWDYIPEEYMNLGVYKIANTLLPTDNLIYKPADTGYAEALQKILQNVDFGENPDLAHLGIKTEFEHALRDEAKAQEVFEKELDEAQMRWASALKYGSRDRWTNFLSFVGKGRVPDFSVAQRQLDAAFSKALIIGSMMNPELAAPWKDDRFKVAQVFHRLDCIGAEWNMNIAYGDFLCPFELKRMEREIKEIPKPDAIPVPWYSAPSYKPFVQAAEERLAGKFEPGDLNSFTFNAQDGPGEIKINSASNSPFDIWLGFKTDSDSFPLYQEDETNLIQVKVIFDKIGMIPITRGEWDVDLSRYKLRNDAPADLKTLTRPSSMVVATGLGYEITLGPKTADWVIYFVEKVMEGKGDVTIFGSRVDVRPDAERKKYGGEYLFKGDWDNGTRNFKAIPTFDAGCAFVLGVVGEKLDIRTA